MTCGSKSYGTLFWDELPFDILSITLTNSQIGIHARRIMNRSFTYEGTAEYRIHGTDGSLIGTGIATLRSLRTFPGDPFDLTIFLNIMSDKNFTSRLTGIPTCT